MSDAFVVQLRRVRSYFVGQVEKKSDKPLEPNLTFKSHREMFDNLEAELLKTDANERFNIFYTVGYTDGETARNWYRQDIIAFDIDGVEGNLNPYIDIALDVLKADHQRTVVIGSGNGIHILIQVQKSDAIKDRGFFKRYSMHYKLLMQSLDKAFTEKGLVWKMDCSSFAPNRILRCPGTENRKAGKESKACWVISGKLEPQPWTFESALNMPTIQPVEQIEPREVNSYQLDVDTIEKECRFLTHCRENPEEIDEPTWYAMLSIVGRLKRHGEEDSAARAKVHEYSKKHPSYDKDKTDQKLDQALVASGPRTCENIDNLWDGCEACPHYKKVKSPVSLKDETFIATEFRGFHYISAKGVYIPCYQDLLKFLKREHHYLCDHTSGEVYIYNGSNYIPWTELQVKNFAYNKFIPVPAAKVVNEFYENVRTSGATSREWFETTTENKINFKNGILDTTNHAFLPHSPDFGFMYTLPFPFDPSAECPNFDKFLSDVTDGDASMEAVLVEYVGYSLCCHNTYWLQKALLLVGEGANGKSTFLRIVEELAGRQNISFLSISELHEDTSRCHLEGKLLNISDELPSYNFRNTEMLKKLMGGSVTARRLYQNAAMLRNNAKFVFAANDVPATQDRSHGLFRRLIIAPFNKRFELGDNADPDILDKIIPEASGIFNRCLKAYKAVTIKGDFTECHAIATAVEEYRETVDRVGTWIKDNIHWNGSWKETDPCIRVEDAFERFFSYAKKNEEETCSRHQFTRHMRRVMDHWGERYVRSRNGGGERDYVVRGASFMDSPAVVHPETGASEAAPEGVDRF